MSSLAILLLSLSLPASALPDHEAVDGVVGVATSEHFAYKWGADWAPTEDQQALVLDSLETAWDSQVEDLGFVQPEHSDEARFNVYAGASGLRGAAKTRDATDRRRSASPLVTAAER